MLLDLFTSVWWLINDIFIARIPYAYTNPFVCALWADQQCPSFTETGFPFWQYVITLMIGGPVTSLTQGVVVSILTGEWKRRGPNSSFFRRERYITAVVLLTTAPFMAVGYKLCLEGYVGNVYHGPTTLTSTLMQVVIFNFLADSWFYWTHRMFHEIEWLYKCSHYLHHSAHPVNTFMGNGGDWVELVSQGEMQVFFPPLFVPVQAGVFVINAIFMQTYVLFLHSGERIRMPYHKVIVDPYEHNIHHHFGMKNFNFSLYFTFWDRVMGTHKECMPSWDKAKSNLQKASQQAKMQPSITLAATKTPAQMEQEKYKNASRRTSGNQKLGPLLYQTFHNCLDAKPVFVNVWASLTGSDKRVFP